MIQVNSKITLAKSSFVNLDEAILCELSLNDYIFDIMVVYNKPRTNKLNFVEKLDDVSEGLAVIILVLSVEISTSIFCKKTNSAIYIAIHLSVMVLNAA